MSELTSITISSSLSLASAFIQDFMNELKARIHARESMKDLETREGIAAELIQNPDGFAEIEATEDFTSNELKSALDQNNIDYIIVPGSNGHPERFVVPKSDIQQMVDRGIFVDDAGNFTRRAQKSERAEEKTDSNNEKEPAHEDDPFGRTEKEYQQDMSAGEEEASAFFKGNAIDIEDHSKNLISGRNGMYFLVDGDRHQLLSDSNGNLLIADPEYVSNVKKSYGSPEEKDENSSFYDAEPDKAQENDENEPDFNIFSPEEEKEEKPEDSRSEDYLPPEGSVVLPAADVHIILDESGNFICVYNGGARFLVADNGVLTLVDEEDNPILAAEIREINGEYFVVREDRTMVLSDENGVSIKADQNDPDSGFEQDEKGNFVRISENGNRLMADGDEQVLVDADDNPILAGDEKEFEEEETEHLKAVKETLKKPGDEEEPEDHSEEEEEMVDTAIAEMARQEKQRRINQEQVDRANREAEGYIREANEAHERFLKEGNVRADNVLTFIEQNQDAADRLSLVLGTDRIADTAQETAALFTDDEMNAILAEAGVSPVTEQMAGEADGGTGLFSAKVSQAKTEDKKKEEGLVGSRVNEDGEARGSSITQHKGSGEKKQPESIFLKKEKNAISEEAKAMAFRSSSGLKNAASKEDAGKRRADIIARRRMVVSAFFVKQQNEEKQQRQDAEAKLRETIRQNDERFAAEAELELERAENEASAERLGRVNAGEMSRRAESGLKSGAQAETAAPYESRYTGQSSGEYRSEGSERNELGRPAGFESPASRLEPEKPGYTANEGQAVSGHADYKETAGWQAEEEERQRAEEAAARLEEENNARQAAEVSAGAALSAEVAVRMEQEQRHLEESAAISERQAQETAEETRRPEAQADKQAEAERFRYADEQAWDHTGQREEGERLHQEVQDASAFHEENRSTEQARTDYGQETYTGSQTYSEQSGPEKAEKDGEARQEQTWAASADGAGQAASANQTPVPAYAAEQQSPVPGQTARTAGEQTSAAGQKYSEPELDVSSAGRQNVEPGSRTGQASSDPGQPGYSAESHTGTEDQHREQTHPESGGTVQSKEYQFSAPAGRSDETQTGPGQEAYSTEKHTAASSSCAEQEPSGSKQPPRGHEEQSPEQSQYADQPRNNPEKADYEEEQAGARQYSGRTQDPEAAAEKAAVSGQYDGQTKAGPDQEERSAAWKTTSPHQGTDRPDQEQRPAAEKSGEGPSAAKAEQEWSAQPQTEPYSSAEAQTSSYGQHAAETYPSQSKAGEAEPGRFGQKAAGTPQSQPDAGFASAGMTSRDADRTATAAESAAHKNEQHTQPETGGAGRKQAGAAKEAGSGDTYSSDARKQEHNSPDAGFAGESRGTKGGTESHGTERTPEQTKAAAQTARSLAADQSRDADLHFIEGVYGKDTDEAKTAFLYFNDKQRGENAILSKAMGSGNAKAAFEAKTGEYDALRNRFLEKQYPDYEPEYREKLYSDTVEEREVKGEGPYEKGYASGINVNEASDTSRMKAFLVDEFKGEQGGVLKAQDAFTYLVSEKAGKEVLKKRFADAENGEDLVSAQMSEFQTVRAKLLDKEYSGFDPYTQRQLLESAMQNDGYLSEGGSRSAFETVRIKQAGQHSSSSSKIPYEPYERQHTDCSGASAYGSTENSSGHVKSSACYKDIGNGEDGRYFDSVAKAFGRSALSYYNASMSGSEYARGKQDVKDSFLYVTTMTGLARKRAIRKEIGDQTTSMLTDEDRKVILQLSKSMPLNRKNADPVDFTTTQGMENFRNVMIRLKIEDPKFNLTRNGKELYDRGGLLARGLDKIMPTGLGAYHKSEDYTLAMLRQATLGKKSDAELRQMMERMKKAAANNERGLKKIHSITDKRKQIINRWSLINPTRSRLAGKALQEADPQTAAGLGQMSKMASAARTTWAASSSLYSMMLSFRERHELSEMYRLGKLRAKAVNREGKFGHLTEGELSDRLKNIEADINAHSRKYTRDKAVKDRAQARINKVNDFIDDPLKRPRDKLRTAGQKGVRTAKDHLKQTSAGGKLKTVKVKVVSLKERFVKTRTGNIIRSAYRRLNNFINNKLVLGLRNIKAQIIRFVLRRLLPIAAVVFMALIGFCLTAGVLLSIADMGIPFFTNPVDGTAYGGGKAQGIEETAVPGDNRDMTQPEVSSDNP